MTINKLRKTPEYFKALQTMVDMFNSNPKVQQYVKDSLYFGFNERSILSMLSDDPSKAYVLRTERDQVITDADKQEAYACLEKYFYTLAGTGILVMVAASRRDTLIRGVTVATLTGQIIDHERMFKSSTQQAMLSCVRNNRPAKHIRNLLKYDVGNDFIWASWSNNVPENILRFFKKNEIPTKMYWRACAMIAQLHYNPVLFMHAFKDLELACEVQNTPEHRALASGAVNRLGNKYKDLSQVEPHSITDYVRSAPSKSEAIESLLTLCRDTMKMYYAIPGNNRYGTARRKCTIKELRNEHDRLIPMYNAQLAQNRVEMAARRGERAKQKDIEKSLINAPIEYQDFAPAEMHIDEYDIIRPLTRSEIVDEGIEMSNCVASYAARHALKSTFSSSYMYIMFAREKDGSRLATVEVRYDETTGEYTIPQFYKKANRTDERTKRIQAEYLEFLTNGSIPF